MNQIPTWIYIAVALIGLVLTLAGKKKRKNGLTYIGFLACILGVGLFISAYLGMFKPDSTTVTSSSWNAEAYGVAKVIKEHYPNKKVVVLGWRPETDQHVQNYMKCLEESGVSGAKYIAIANNPPIGISIFQQTEWLTAALDKAGDANLFVYRNAVMPYEYVDSDGYNEDHLFIQTYDDANQGLWDEGIVVATIKAKIGKDLSTISTTDPEVAFQQAYEIKMNSNAAHE